MFLSDSRKEWATSPADVNPHCCSSSGGVKGGITLIYRGWGIRPPFPPQLEEQHANKNHTLQLRWEVLHGIYLSNNNNNNNTILKESSAEAGSVPFNTANVEGPNDNHSDITSSFNKGAQQWLPGCGCFRSTVNLQLLGVPAARPCMAEIQPNVTELYRKMLPITLLTWIPLAESQWAELTGNLSLVLEGREKD